MKNKTPTTLTLKLTEVIGATNQDIPSTMHIFDAYKDDKYVGFVNICLPTDTINTPSFTEEITLSI